MLHLFFYSHNHASMLKSVVEGEREDVEGKNDEYCGKENVIHNPLCESGFNWITITLLDYLSNSKAIEDAKKIERATDKVKSMYDGDGPIRVVVYRRIKPDGLGQTASLELIKLHYRCFVDDKLKWKLLALYVDEDNCYKPETNPEERAGAKRLLEDAKNGKFDVIFIKNFTNLSYRLIDCMKVIDTLRNLPNPVGIIFESENIYTLDKSDECKLKILSIAVGYENVKEDANLASFYSYQIKEL